mmetsp:Transcript_42006/g.90741  ORF Transcript_42006/g.90741 Transcript_42006/m.90741 type:complete len:205 (-) Transcript_42006:208-822(-)
MFKKSERRALADPGRVVVLQDLPFRAVWRAMCELRESHRRRYDEVRFGQVPRGVHRLQHLQESHREGLLLDCRRRDIMSGLRNPEGPVCLYRPSGGSYASQHRCIVEGWVRCPQFQPQPFESIGARRRASGSWRYRRSWWSQPRQPRQPRPWPSSSCGRSDGGCPKRKGEGEGKGESQGIFAPSWHEFGRFGHGLRLIGMTAHP